MVCAGRRNKVVRAAMETAAAAPPAGTQSKTKGRHRSMTLLATWYHPNYDEVWSVADSRISTLEHGPSTDSGVKIFPIPIVTHAFVNKKWVISGLSSLGFAYAGNSTCALNTHALASACTQNLGATTDIRPGPPSVEAIARLFARVGEHYIRDVGSRQHGVLIDPKVFLFDAHIFGFCAASGKYKAFMISFTLASTGVEVNVHDLNLSPQLIYVLGSRAQQFKEAVEELSNQGKSPDPIRALYQIIQRNEFPDVGGHLQLGAAGKGGFRLSPILNTSGELDRHVTFLGFSTSSVDDVDGYMVGFNAFAPDIPTGWSVKPIPGPGDPFPPILYDMYAGDQWLGSRRTLPQCFEVFRNAGLPAPTPAEAAGAAAFYLNGWRRRYEAHVSTPRPTQTE
jgi:hypothetical protein